MRSDLTRMIQSAEHYASRSEEHTSELQSPCNLVCRLLLEKKKMRNIVVLRAPLLPLISPMPPCYSEISRCSIRMLSPNPFTNPLALSTASPTRRHGQRVGRTPRAGGWGGGGERREETVGPQEEANTPGPPAGARHRTGWGRRRRRGAAAGRPWRSPSFFFF